MAEISAQIDLLPRKLHEIRLHVVLFYRRQQAGPAAIYDALTKAKKVAEKQNLSVRELSIDLLVGLEGYMLLNSSSEKNFDDACNMTLRELAKVLRLWGYYAAVVPQLQDMSILMIPAQYEAREIRE